jgi:polyadenylation factor subunit 2
MMRDVLLLRGHEKDVITMAWHPMHKNLLSTGGHDGSIMHYLLDEQNSPVGVAPSLSPYDSADPQNAPAQTIYPAHAIPYAHDFTIWTMDWHPLGHILATGSNDRVTRFWTRPRPGDEVCFKDRYHIGQAAAEAQGTFDRGQGRRQMREEEEMEAEDEEEGLVDQKLAPKVTGLPPGLSLPGLNVGDGSSSALPGIGGVPPPPPNFTGGFPQGLPHGMPPPPPGGMDPARLAQLIASGALPPPPPLQGNGNGPPPPFPPPNFPFPGMNPNGGPPLPFPPPGMQGMPGMPPPNFPFPPPPPNMGGPVPPNLAPPQLQQGESMNSDGSVRRRGPLPSQQESLKAEMSRGKFRTRR